MAKEFKFIPFAGTDVEIKADGSSSGVIKGHPNPTAVLDEGADIILPGAFKDAIDEFLKAGFTAHSHDWSFDGVIGYPVKAEEDEIGLYVESQFHSTPDAQNVRIKAQERLAAGLQVGLSIGYEIVDPPKFIFPKEYETELPKYVRADQLEEALAKSKRFPKIRLLSKVNIFEYSIVTAPMNRRAQAASVKSFEFDVKGIFEEVVSEQTNSFSNLTRMLGYALDRLRWAANSSDNAGATLDVDGLLVEILNEFNGRVTEAFTAALQSGEYWSTYYGGYYYDGQSGALSKFLSGKQGAAPAPTLVERSNLAASACEEFAQNGAQLVDALKTLAEDGTERHEFRTKEGRTISQATANKITTAKTQIDDAIPVLGKVSSALTDLLELAAPKEKANPDDLRLSVEFEFEKFKRTQAIAAH